MRDFLRGYLINRPLHLAIIRSVEAKLYQPYLPFKKPILDLGCGDGFFAKTAFGDYGKIDVGLDIDKKILKEAEESEVYKKVNVFDGQKIPYPDNYFSTIISNCVLEHVENLDELIEEIKRVLKPGGVFLTTVATDKFPDFLYLPRILKKIGLTKIADWYVNWFNKKSKHKNLLAWHKWQKKFRNSSLTVIKRRGYLNNLNQIKIFELAHYLSLPDLFGKFLFKRWILFPNLALLRYKIFLNLIQRKERTTEEFSPYFFFFIKKKI